jgi:hypothetical protein
VRGTPKELNAMQARLMKLIGGVAGRGPKAGAEGSPYRLTIALFPLADGRRSS